VTCWWLSRDRSVPSADAASHLFTTLRFHGILRSADVGAFWTSSGFYPPLTFALGALATLVGGLNATGPVVGENLLYVSLLALGCYQTGRLVAGRRAGFLAVVFALGSPLLIEQFHVFMIDAPEAALIAVAVWLILATERFRRPGVSAVAGLVVGLGLESKEQFPLFVIGLLAVVVLRGQGWRNWRGIALFAAVAIVVGLPWYAVNLSHIGEYAGAGLANANLPPRGKPAILSASNVGWYFWAVVNSLLFAPLACFAAIGVARAAWATLRAWRPGIAGIRLDAHDCRPELLGGLCGAWLALSLTPHHDMRYTMGMIVYLAVLGTSWIVPLRLRWGVPVSIGLALAVLATTLGATWGVGGEVRILLAGRPVVTDHGFGIPPPDQLTIFSTHDFVVSAPRHSGVPGLFAALRREGFTGVGWLRRNALVGDPLFDLQGLELLARFTGVSAPPLDLTRSWDVTNPRHALLYRQSLQQASSPPCVLLGDGSGVWVVVRGGRMICPAS
jgi:hypothetical protein